MKTTTLLFAILFLSAVNLHAQEKTKNMENLTERAKLSCKLTTPELQQRKKTVVAELKSLLLEKTELKNGFKYKFDGSDKMLDLLNSFIKTERLCCDFFVFNLTASSDTKFTWLELTGPEGVKDFIEYEIEF